MEITWKYRVFCGTEVARVVFFMRREGLCSNRAIVNGCAIARPKDSSRHSATPRQSSEAHVTMLASWRVGRQSHRTSFRRQTWTGNQIGPVQKRGTLRNARLPTLNNMPGNQFCCCSGAGREHAKYLSSLAKSSIDILSKNKHACCWPRSSAVRGSDGAENLRTSLPKCHVKAGGAGEIID